MSLPYKVVFLPYKQNISFSHNSLHGYLIALDGLDCVRGLTDAANVPYAEVAASRRQLLDY